MPITYANPTRCQDTGSGSFLGHGTAQAAYFDGTCASSSPGTGYVNTGVVGGCSGGQTLWVHYDPANPFPAGTDGMIPVQASPYCRWLADIVLASYSGGVATWRRLYACCEPGAPGGTGLTVGNNYPDASGFCLCCVNGSGKTYDPVSRKCLASICASSFCFCITDPTALVGDCFTCPTPPCSVERGCTWNPDLCRWDCSIPICPTCYSWNMGSCSCVSGITPPPCQVQLHCFQNADCSWSCDNPNAPGYCPAGYWWSTASCSCVTCPMGQVWCEASQSCIVPVDPACKTTLNCIWDQNSCDYTCDPIPCTVTQTWDEGSCVCVNDGGHVGYLPSGGLALVENDNYVKVAAYSSANAIWTDTIEVNGVINSRQVTTPGGGLADFEPHLLVGWDNTLSMLFTRSDGAHTNTVYYCDDSPDAGESFSTPVILFTNAKHAKQAASQSKGVRVAIAIFSNRLVGKIIDAGETTWSAQFDCKEWTGGVYANIAVADDSIDLLYEEYGLDCRLLLTARRTGASAYTLFESFDEGATWRSAPY